MNILMLTQRFPYPPTRGDTLRAWHELDYLSSRHDVWLASTDLVAPNSEDFGVVSARCRDVAVSVRSSFRALMRGIGSLLRGQSLTAGYFADLHLAQRLRAWSEAHHFDAVLTYSSGMAPFAELVPAGRRVLDMVDVDSAKYVDYASRTSGPLSWLYALEARRLAMLEDHAARGHDVTLLVNERERRKLSSRPDSAPTAVVPTCVESPSASEPIIPHTLRVGMVGSMFYPPNVRAVEWFGAEVWPLIRSVCPRVEWWIVGARPRRTVRRWGREAGVTVTGTVPDIQPYLDDLRVLINPVRGDLGVQSKTIVALAAGKPCVVTPDVADGIDYEGDPPFLIATTPRDFADAVLRVVHDDALASALSRRGRHVVRSHYDAATQLARVEQHLGDTPPSQPTDNASYWRGPWAATLSNEHPEHVLA
ncbi:MAG: glycosyltransferase [Phycisphaerae bacterium]|nr:glycosyltransferase [Phycisphaerae bacterium]